MLHRARQGRTCPAASQNRRLNQSPIDALINLVIGGRLCCQIPIRRDVHPVIHLRITAIPQRWPANRGYVYGLRVDPNVIQNPPDLHALGN